MDSIGVLTKYRTLPILAMDWNCIKQMDLAVLGILQNTNAANAAIFWKCKPMERARLLFSRTQTEPVQVILLHVMTNGTGYAEHLQSTNASPKALLPNGSVLINDATQSIR